MVYGIRSDDVNQAIVIVIYLRSFNRRKGYCPLGKENSNEPTRSMKDGI